MRENRCFNTRELFKVCDFVVQSFACEWASRFFRYEEESMVFAVFIFFLHDVAALSFDKIVQKVQ
ncbi:hypothetical protein D9M73_254760 [compost metagenome]